MVSHSDLLNCLTELTVKSEKTGCGTIAASRPTEVGSVASMAFFGLETSNPIEEEKRRFLAGESTADEDIAVYNWGQDDYDGLGNALQEGRDELNDETFGGSEPVGEFSFHIVCRCLFRRLLIIIAGKDFDFTAQTLPGLERRPKQGNVTTGSSATQEPQPQFRSLPQVQTQLIPEALKSAQQSALHPLLRRVGSSDLRIQRVRLLPHTSLCGMTSPRSRSSGPQTALGGKPVPV